MAIWRHRFGTLFPKRYDVLPLNLMKSRCREIGCYNDRIALKYNRHLGSSVSRCLSNFRAIRNVMISSGKTFVHLLNRSSGSTLVQLMTYCLPKRMSTHTNLQWSRMPISQEKLKIYVLDVSLKMYNLRLQVTRIHIEAETHERVILVFIYWSFVGRIDHSSVDTHHKGPSMWSFLDFFVVKLHENSWT